MCHQLIPPMKRRTLCLCVKIIRVFRYNCERLNNSLKRVEKFSNWREPIPEAYFPKLDSLTSSRGWPPRQANMVWQDMDRPVDGLKITVRDMENWRTNIEEAIATGMVRLVSIIYVVIKVFLTFMGTLG